MSKKPSDDDASKRQLTRRDFIKTTGALSAAYWLGPKLIFGGLVYADIPGTLDPVEVIKFTTPLLIPPAMPLADQIKWEQGKHEDCHEVDYYEIAIRQFQQQILPAGYFPKTTVWGYGPKVAQKGPKIFNAPSLTIEAEYQKPVRIKWSNELVDKYGNYLPHLLPVDPTLHWANPPGGKSGRDTRPAFTATPLSYTGPVPLITHVHGAVGVGDESDGYAEAWFLPAAKNIPKGYAKVGTWYDFFKNKAHKKFDVNWEPGSSITQYPNDQRAATNWYHDHSMGITRLNVYAGPAGFFIVRGGPDDVVIDSRNHHKAILPGPAPAQNDKSGTKYYEIPIAIQDRTFNADGSLFYPNTRAFFDGEITGTGPYIPFSDLSPIWNPETFGDSIMVNGNTWPFLNVEQRRYRLRFLNGCNARSLVLKFDNPNVKVWQIGAEGGFLVAPVNMNTTKLYPDEDISAGNARLLLMSAERADVIVDFSGVKAGTSFNLLNIGPNIPFNGFPILSGDVADPATTGLVMKFSVIPAVSKDKSTPPEFLKLPVIPPLPVSKRPRKLCLCELTSSTFADAPNESRLGIVDSATGDYQVKKWSDPVTENPGVGDTEIWEFYNTTVDAHPMHIHEVTFEVINRQGIIISNQDTVAGTGNVKVDPNSPKRTPLPLEIGRKDTVIALPGEVTRVKATFLTPGQFVWHCHIVEHEDNEMMRPYRIGPLQKGQPPEGK